MAGTKPKAAPGKAIARIGADRSTVYNLLAQVEPALQRALPKHVDARQLGQIAFFCIRQTPLLAECTKASFLGAVMQCAKLGLYPDVRGLCFLIPRKTGPVDPETGDKSWEAHFQIGYQGLLELAQRSDRVESIEAHVVYQNDEFDYRKGTDKYVTHEPYRGDDPGPLVACYAVAWVKGARLPQFEVLEHRDIEAIKSAAHVGKSSLSPWKGPFEAEMWRKTAVKRLCKYLPASTELSSAAHLDNLSEAELPQGLAAQAVDQLGFTDDESGDALDVDDVLPPDGDGQGPVSE